MANLLRHPSPSQLLTVQLLDYQLQGLAWMVNCEHPQPPKYSEDRKNEEIVQFWRAEKDAKVLNI